MGNTSWRHHSLEHKLPMLTRDSAIFNRHDLHDQWKHCCGGAFAMGEPFDEQSLLTSGSKRAHAQG